MGRGSGEGGEACVYNQARSGRWKGFPRAGMTLATRPNGREKKRRRRVGEKPEGRSKPPGSDDRRGVSRGSCDCLMDGKSEWAMASEVSLALAHGSRWPGEGDPVWQQSRAPGGSGISARRDRQGTDERGQKKDDEVVSAEADNEAAVVMGRERERGEADGLDRQAGKKASSESENEKRAGSGGV